MKPGTVKISVEGTGLAVLKIAALRTEIIRTETAAARMTAALDGAGKSLVKFLGLLSEASTVLDSVGDIFATFPDMPGVAASTSSDPDVPPPEKPGPPKNPSGEV